MQEAWEGFKEGIWTGEVDVRDFIQKNYTPYDLSLIHISAAGWLRPACAP